MCFRVMRYLPISLRITTSLRHPAHASPALFTLRHSLSPISRNITTEKVSLKFIDAEGKSKIVSAPIGESLLDVAHENDIELEGACGGELACSTCHLIFKKHVFDELPEISEEEEDMLDLAWGLTETSRLGCQIKVTKSMEGTTVRVPEDTNNLL